MNNEIIRVENPDIINHLAPGTFLTVDGDTEIPESAQLAISDAVQKFIGDVPPSNLKKTN